MTERQRRTRTPRPTPRSLRVAQLAVMLPAWLLLAVGSLGPLRAQAPEPPQMEAGLTSAAMAGSVSDSNGALVPGATVSLVPTETLGTQLSVSADAEGHFRFAGLKPGLYVLTASAPGFDAFTSPRIMLHAGEARELVAISLALPVDRADVTVTEPRRDRADLELHAAEQQRVLGIFPNFYTSFEPDPAPLDAGQKFSLAFHATLDPTAFFTAGAVAAGEQMKNTFPTFGQGTRGYAKRYGAAYADGFSGKFIGSALLPSLFRQDPRYLYLGTGGFKHRLWHVLGSAVLARGDNGRIEPNYSHILGNAGAGAMSTLYHPAADSAGKLALDNALLGTVGEAAVNFTREFLLRPFTRGVPAFAPHP